MFDLENEDLYFPNTKVMRNYLESLNYTLKPISSIVRRDPVAYTSICFSEWITHFENVKQTNKMYFCTDNPNLTEEQSIFVFNILHICPDFQTFEEALQQYINKPLE